MSTTEIISFPCNACGECCRRVNRSEQTVFLDRGDGTCRYFDELSRLCTIYENRPLICRVEDFYEKYLSEEITWQDFIKINQSVCRELQHDASE